eukprot:scaffold57843_cov60-Phaeocystis_antarctica.AAC.2
MDITPLPCPVGHAGSGAVLRTACSRPRGHNSRGWIASRGAACGSAFEPAWVLATELQDTSLLRGQASLQDASLLGGGGGPRRLGGGRRRLAPRNAAHGSLAPNPLTCRPLVCLVARATCGDVQPGAPARQQVGTIDLDDLRYPDRAVHLLGRGLAGGDESSGWGGRARRQRRSGGDGGADGGGGGESGGCGVGRVGRGRLPVPPYLEERKQSVEALLTVGLLALLARVLAPLGVARWEVEERGLPPPVLLLRLVVGLRGGQLGVETADDGVLAVLPHARRPPPRLALADATVLRRRQALCGLAVWSRLGSRGVGPGGATPAAAALALLALVLFALRILALVLL